jgi:hypothetical protein
MRSQFGPERFLLASKKPHVRELVARVPGMTEDEIRALPERPDTIKGLLNLKRQGDQAEALERATRIADMMMLRHPPPAL